MDLTTKDLLGILSSRIQHFKGVFARDKLPQKLNFPSCFIINTQNSDQSGEHWLAFYYDEKGNAEFFDSYGNHPSYFDLESYLNNTSKNWTWNKKQLQSFNSPLCGYYCSLYLLYKNLNFDLQYFLKKFSNNFNVNDLVLLILIKSN